MLDEARLWDEADGENLESDQSKLGARHFLKLEDKHALGEEMYLFIYFKK